MKKKTESLKEKETSEKKEKKHLFTWKIWMGLLAGVIAVVLIGLGVPAFEQSKTQTIKALVMPQDARNVLIIPDPSNGNYSQPVSVPIEKIDAADFDPSSMKQYELVEAVVSGNDNGAFRQLYTLKSIEDPQLEYLFNMYLASIMGSNGY